MRFILAISFICIFGAVSCTLNKSSAPQRLAGKMIEQSYAKYRADLIKNVKYNLSVDITGADTYTGTNKISFDIARPSELTVDFFDGKVLGVKVNDKPVDKIVYNNFFITLPESAFAQGTNSIEVTFEHAYNKTGSGLYRFLDPEDKQSYLYTDFEPYDAQVFMPCFDQPDLKATYQSTVIAPSEWVVVSSTLESQVDKKDKTAVWTFPESAKFSTYLFSLHAGPYKIWNNTIVTKNHKIPHRVMARQSLAKYVDPKEWFTNIQKGFEFFEAYFDYPYPFLKYDEVIVPDFNSGAMENVAAVTFNENRFISRGQKTRAEKRRLANTQLHELAHMWFGDLVTMKWWNDIWLNESFATYAAFRAMEGNSEYKEEGLDFIVGAKGSAYREDQLVTTHPIAFDVPNTDVVFANFDGITYGKGASVLKQLNFYLGDEAFKKGLQAYFKKHQYQNTELKDFIGALEESSGKDLKEWQKVWLQQAQVNTIRVDYKCDQGLTKDAVLVQTAPKEYPTLRPHKAQVGVFTLNKDSFNLLKTIDITYSEESTQLNELNGIECDKIALIYPNYMDHDYVLVNLDEKSLNTLMTKISLIKDEMLKVGLWSTLWDMVIAQKIPATQVFDIILAHSEKETSPEVLATNIGRASQVAHQYLSKDESMKAQKEKAIQRLSDFYSKNMKSAKTNDLQELWLNAFISNSVTDTDLETVRGLLFSTPKWMKIPMDQDRRWQIVRHLSSRGFKDYAALLEAEKVRDASARAEKSILASQAAVPDLTVKKQFFAKVLEGPSKEFSLGKLGSVAYSLFPRDQEELHRQFREDFFKNLKDMKGQTGEFLSVYMGLTPSFCATESVNELRDFVAKNGDLPPRVLKTLKIEAQLSERCVGIRQKILQTEANKAI